MSNFTVFQQAIAVQMEKMKSLPLFRVALDREEVIETYLAAFPPGTNEIFRVNTEHDCSCCKQFIRAAGGLVGIKSNGERVSIWDIQVDDPTYQTVADAMSAYVKDYPITDKFMHYENHIGTHHNFEANPAEDENHMNLSPYRWDHFYIDVPAHSVMDKDAIDSYLGDIRTSKQMFYTAMAAFTDEALTTVVDLIAQGSIYRGEEHAKAVKNFIRAKKAWGKVLPARRHNHAWVTALTDKGICRFKNSVIGTLIADLSDGTDLEDAVKKFESKVAPENYKRSTALVTQGMIKKAQEKVAELGIEDALYRRYATADDLTINNVLFADRTVEGVLTKDGLFDSLPTKSVSKRKYDNVQEIHINDFIKDVVPTIDTMELMVEGRHKNNLVSLIAPKSTDVQPILKWGNNFTWSYNGNVTDSIKERVKEAGGDVTGDLRLSLSWFNTDDLDLHLVEPGGNNIGFQSKRSRTGGKLDVDMNAGGRNNSTNPVENITYAEKKMMPEGKYRCYVNQYARRNTTDFGFVLEMEFMGTVTQFHYEKAMNSGSNVTAIEFNYSKKNGIEVIAGLPASGVSQELWGLQTENFARVKMLMNSPNHWDGEETGNKHFFFVLDDCANNESARGFYNEFLDNKLNEHRKVFELLGSKTMVEPTDNQLSGLGFSSTKPDFVMAKVSGGLNQVLKITF